MSLPAGRLLPCGKDVPVYARVLPGDAPPAETAAQRQRREKEKRAMAKMGVGAGPSCDMVMKSFARSGEPADPAPPPAGEGGSRSGSVSACSSYADYVLWWDGLRDERACGDFLGDLVFFCLSLHDSKMRKMNKAWFDKVQLTPASSFAMARRAGKTIHYLACLYQVGRSARLVSALSAWHTAVVGLAREREKGSSKLSSTTILDSPVVVHSILLLERAMSQASNRSGHAQQGGSIDWRGVILSRLVESTFVGPEPEAAAIAADGGTHYDGSFYIEGDEDGDDAGEGEGGLAGGVDSMPQCFAFSSAGDFPYIMSVINEVMWWSFPLAGTEPGTGQAAQSSGAYMVYEAIGQLLKRLHKSLRSNPDVTRSTFMSVLVIFRSLLMRFPILSTDFLAGLHDVLLPYLRWPRPYGTAAADMLSLLEAEAKSPGVTLRHWHMTCRPLLSARGRQLIAAGSVSMAQLRLWNRIGSTVYLYYDSQSPLVRTFAELIRQVNGDDASEEEATGAKPEGVGGSKGTNTGWGRLLSPRTHDLLDVQRMIITQIVDAEFIILRHQSIVGAQATPVNYVKSPALDPLGLQRASGPQVTAWFRVAVDVANHDFVAPAGMQQDWRPSNAFESREERQRALRRLVATIFRELGGDVEAPTLTPRGDRGDAEDMVSVVSEASNDIRAAPVESRLLGVAENGAGHQTKHAVHAVPPLDPSLAVDLRPLFDPAGPGTALAPDLSEDRVIGFLTQTLEMVRIMSAFAIGYGVDGTGDGTTGTTTGTNQDKAVLRFAVMADGRSFHHFLCNFVRACMAFSDSLESEKSDSEDEGPVEDGGASGIPAAGKRGGPADMGHHQVTEAQRENFRRAMEDGAIRVYPIPTGASDVASYLAANDGLYRRQILTSFAMQPEYVPALPVPYNPRRELRLPPRVTIHKDNAAPMRLAPSIFMDYLCNAQQAVDLKIYSCECWPVEDGSSASSSESDPSALVGRAAVATTVMGTLHQYADLRGGGIASGVASAYNNNNNKQKSHHRDSSTSDRPMVLGSDDRSMTRSSASSVSSNKRKSSRGVQAGAELSPLVVPFLTRVEIGVSVAVEQYVSSAEGGAGAETSLGSHGGDSVDKNWDKHLMSKGFHAFWSGMADPTPTLCVKFTETDTDGNVLPLMHEQHLSPNTQYASVSVSNMFKYTRTGSPPNASSTTRIDHRVPCSPGTSPERPSLGLRCVPLQQGLSDALRKRKMSVDEVLAFNSQMRASGESRQHHAGVVDIRCERAGAGFSVLIDGVLYGPMRRIR
jgi:hypothetical protein